MIWVMAISVAGDLIIDRRTGLIFQRNGVQSYAYGVTDEVILNGPADLNALSALEMWVGMMMPFSWPIVDNSGYQLNRSSCRVS